MYHYARVSLLLSAVLLTTSCSDTDARSPMGPSSIGTASLELQPTSTTTFAQAVANSSCPEVAPFDVPFGFSVKTIGWSSVILTRIRAQFTDSSGVRAPEVTLPAPGPTPIFGNATPSTFPMRLGIGCGTGTRGVLVVIVDASDGRGRHGTGQVTIVVR